MPLEDRRTREGMRRSWQEYGRCKSLNENLAPLRRYLRSQVGRPWDNVYGEICERINRRSAVQLHIWQHLAEYVCTDPHVISGEVHRHGLFGSLRNFYVDPRTGLLRYNEGYGRRRWRPSPLRRRTTGCA